MAEIWYRYPTASKIDDANAKEMANNGMMKVSETGVLDNRGTIANTANFLVASGGSVSSAGAYTQTGAGLTQVDGAWTQGLTTIQGGVLRGSGIVGGSLKNQGIVAGASAGGIKLTGAVSGPGNYAGKVTFTGSLSRGNGTALITGQTMIFDISNNLIIEIGGLARHRVRRDGCIAIRARRRT